MHTIPLNYMTNTLRAHDTTLLWNSVDRWIKQATALPTDLRGIADWRSADRGVLETAQRYQPGSRPSPLAPCADSSFYLP